MMAGSRTPSTNKFREFFKNKVADHEQGAQIKEWSKIYARSFIIDKLEEGSKVAHNEYDDLQFFTFNS